MSGRGMPLVAVLLAGAVAAASAESNALASEGQTMASEGLEGEPRGSLLPWPRLRRFPGGEASMLLGRRLSAVGVDVGDVENGSIGNETMMLTAEEGDAVINAVIGTLIAMGGTKIQPVILLINGFIAAEVGKAFSSMLDDFNPDTIIGFFLRLISGFSVGTVGIQNINVQSPLQGGVLFASLLASARAEVETWILDTFEFGQEWILMGVDVFFTSLGSMLAIAFMALFKVLNSSYLSATMVVGGWVTIIESYAEVDIPAWVETLATVVVALGCLWWHSLIVSSARAGKWKKLAASPPRTQFQSWPKRLAAAAVAPVAVANKVVTAFSQSLGRAFNLQAKPLTTKQIFNLVLAELNLPSVGMLIAKQFTIRECKEYAASVLKENGADKDEVKKAITLTGLVCGALDVSTMKALLFELESGSGNILQVLDGCFEDVSRAIQQQQLLKPVDDDEPASTDPRRLKPDQLAEVWGQCSNAIVEGTLRAVRKQVKRALPTYCGVRDKAQMEYLSDLADHLELQEMIAIMRMIRTNRFQLSDLTELLEQKASEARSAALRAGRRAVQDAGVHPAAGAVAAAVNAGPAEVQGASDKILQAEAVHSAAPPEPAQGDGAVASAALQKSREDAVGKLAEMFTDILDFNQLATKLPGPTRLLLKAAVEPFKKVRFLVESATVVLPVVGPQVGKVLDMLESKAKAKVISMGLGKLIRQANIPMEQVAKVIQAMASQDEYLVDTLNDMLTSAVQGEGAVDAAAAGSAAGQAINAAQGHKELGGLAGFIVQLVEELGPGRCREKLVYCMVEFLEIDLMVADKFVKQLGIKELMKLGQEIVCGGFPFDECTEQAANNVEEIIFEVGLEDIGDAITEAQLSISFGSPPRVVSVDTDWAEDAAGDTGTKVPQKGDALLTVGHKPAANMTKQEFELEVQAFLAAQRSAVPTEGSKPPALRLKFRRGLDIDFAERFREKVPSVLRRFVGVPMLEGKEFARNMTTSTMQELVRILLQGNLGLKKLDDLANSMCVEVDFENAFKSQIPTLLYRKFGFRFQGASKFAAALDPSTTSVLVRFFQMIGRGELEAMFSIITTGNVMALDQLHMRRFQPRVDLDRLLPTNPLLEPAGTTVNLVVSEQGNLELWKNGKVLGQVHEDTLVMVLNTWREYQALHIDEDDGPIDGVLPFESAQALEKLKGARTDIHAMRAQKRFFKWPDMAIENAELSPNDAEAAQQLFFQALEDVRESVWKKYERMISVAAQKALGAPAKEVKSADAEEADVAEALQEDPSGDDTHKGVHQWMEQVFEGLPPAPTLAKMFPSGARLSPKANWQIMKQNAKGAKTGFERARQLKKIETAVGKRDLFRLQQVASRCGVSAPVPAEGMMKQLRGNLSMLPPDVDIVANADKLAAFVAASQHPLTGKRAAPAKVGDGETSAPAAPEPAGDRVLQPEAVHSVAPLQGGAAPALRMKELFDLAQKGGFETLGRFVAPSVPGGAGAVAERMRGALVAQLQGSFPQVPQHRAQEAADCFLPVSHRMLASTKVATEDGTPTLLDSSPSIPETGQRDGPELAKKTKVAVAEEKGELTRIARPLQGWVRTSELEALESARAGDTAAISLAMRSLKNYDLKNLAEMSDELGWGLDFSSMSQERIVQAVLERSESYQAPVLKKAARSLDEEVLRSILQALDRKDLPFVIEALKLPAAPKKAAPKEAEVVEGVPEPPRKKTKEEKELERQVRVLQQGEAELRQREAELQQQVRDAQNKSPVAAPASEGGFFTKCTAPSHATPIEVAV